MGLDIIRTAIIPNVVGWQQKKKKTPEQHAPGKVGLPVLVS